MAPKKLGQEAPGSLKRLFIMDDMDGPTKRKKKKKTNRIIVRTLNHRNGTASFVSQNIYETNEQFLRRVSQMANRAREKADISAKFDVHFNEDGSLTHEVSDSASVLTRKKRRLQEYKEKRKAKSMILKKPRDICEETNRPPKEFPGKERFKFGEVVHAPPEITAKLRGAPKRDPKKTIKSLMCNPENMGKVKKSLSSDSHTSVEQAPKENKAKEVRSGDFDINTISGLEKIRWKSLEASKRAELEVERERVIEAYRRLKNKA
ncbi:uncharacterized protein LOC111244178 isoform X2 [Varroa destructor]|nr:uncharacterized protein LOC111244178 isoform X2 [Varroa destructor]XP_022646694.1 uncharacterized protein LOC111244178 isoform X2 [Varroa destructor]